MKKILRRVLRKIIIHNRFLLPIKLPRVSQLSSEVNLQFTGESALMDMKSDCTGIFREFNKDTSVMIKINANSAYEYPASTSIELLQIIVEMLKKRGVKKICVADCSAISRLPSKSILMQKGLTDLKKSNIKIKTFDYGPWARVNINARHFKDIVIPTSVYKYDRIINLANLKTHKHAGYTSAVKNLIGFMHPYQRFELHRTYLEQRIAEMPLAIYPDINIIDARKVFVVGGPDYGECAHANCIIVDSNLVRADLTAYNLLKKTQAVTGVEPMKTGCTQNPVLKALIENTGYEQ